MKKVDLEAKIKRLEEDVTQLVKVIEEHKNAQSEEGFAYQELWRQKVEAEAKLKKRPMNLLLDKFNVMTTYRRLMSHKFNQDTAYLVKNILTLKHEKQALMIQNKKLTDEINEYRLAHPSVIPHALKLKAIKRFWGPEARENAE